MALQIGFVLFLARHKSGDCSINARLLNKIMVSWEIKHLYFQHVPEILIANM